MGYVKILKNDDKESYKEFCKNNGRIFHLPEWKSIIETYKHKPYYLLYEENNKIIGVFQFHLIINKTGSQ